MAGAGHCGIPRTHHDGMWGHPRKSAIERPRPEGDLDNRLSTTPPSEDWPRASSKEGTRRLMRAARYRITGGTRRSQPSSTTATRRAEPQGSPSLDPVPSCQWILRGSGMSNDRHLCGQPAPEPNRPPPACPQGPAPRPVPSGPSSPTHAPPGQRPHASAPGTSIYVTGRPPSTSSPPPSRTSSSSPRRGRAGSTRTTPVRWTSSPTTSWCRPTAASTSAPGSRPCPRTSTAPTTISTPPDRTCCPRSSAASSRPPTPGPRR
jgi:hypothetical protein